MNNSEQVNAYKELFLNEAIIDVQKDEFDHELEITFKNGTKIDITIH